MRTSRAARMRVGVLGAVLLAVGACNGTTSYLDATGRAGRAEAILGRWLTAVACAVVALVCVAVLAGIARHRGEHNEPSLDHSPQRITGAISDAGGARAERREVRGGLSWIYYGLAATIVVLLVTFAGTMVTLSAASRPPLVPSLTMDVTAHQWWWEVRYSDATRPELGFVTANEIHLPVGQPVRVRLQSADVIHSFWLPQIAGKTDVIPGQVNEMWVQADQPGVSRGPCGEYCGLQHANMSIAVTAESGEQFEAWASQRRNPPNSPTSAEAMTGRVVFTRTCGACHAVTGTDALGRVGPDLTHLASRPYIGAGVLANTPQNLSRWIPDAPGVKEGSRMPAIPLDSAALRAVVAYLETLR